MTGEERAVSEFYDRLLSAIESAGHANVRREPDHHGSGYASYVSAFLYPSDGSSRQTFANCVATTGTLLYMSRLAPIAVFGANVRTDSLDGRSSSSSFIGAKSVGVLTDGDWADFVERFNDVLKTFRVELLPRDSLLLPAPASLRIPTVFDPPYYIFDALFYWED